MNAEQILKQVLLSPECGGEHCKEGIECTDCIDGLIKAVKNEAIDECIDEVNNEFAENVKLVPIKVIKRLKRLKGTNE